VVVGLEGMMLLLSWIPMQDEVRRSVAKDLEENYLGFEGSPCRRRRREERGRIISEEDEDEDEDNG